MPLAAVPERISSGFHAYVGAGVMLTLSQHEIMNVFLRALRHSEILPRELCEEMAAPQDGFSTRVDRLANHDRMDMFRASLEDFSKGITPTYALVDQLGCFRLQLKNSVFVSFSRLLGTPTAAIHHNAKKLTLRLQPYESLGALLLEVEAHLSDKTLGDDRQHVYPHAIAFLNGMDAEHIKSLHKTSMLASSKQIQLNDSGDRQP